MGLYQTPLLIASLLLCIRSTLSLGAQRSCPPSYCGDLQISYPFRLKGDKPTCGDRRYELTCDGSRTIIDINSGKYYVISISYSKGHGHIQITNVGLASGDCVFPPNTLSLDTISHDKRFIVSTYIDRDYLSPKEVSFVDCTREIQSWHYLDSDVDWNYKLSRVADTEIQSLHYLCLRGSNRFVNCTANSPGLPYIYSHVPCLSGSKALVYMIFSTRVRDIAPTCRFLGMVPNDKGYNEIARMDEDVIKLLQNGTSLKWVNTICDSVPFVVKYCYADAYREVVDIAYVGQYIRQQDGHFLSWFMLFYLENVLFQMSFFSCLDSAQDCPFNSVFFLLIKVIIVLIYALSLLALARILVRLILSILAVLALLVYKYREMRVPTDAVEKFLINQQSLTPTRYTYTDIIVMTRNFKDKIGQGGFGSVYKGKLRSGFQVAIKILGNSKCNGDDFISEVSTIGTIHHINIVRLVGFCSEGSKRALVYEYLPKGSLDKYIFSSEPANQRPFTLDKLIDIALGIARGIDYLHRGCNMRILHFDIKPPNILLDNSFNPKVSDFGLAKLFPKDYSLVALSAARGTIGYIAPELVSRSFGIISHKSDVYSFGMLLMEMAGGRRNVEPKAENTCQIYYPSWIYDQLDDLRDMQGIVRDVAAIGEIERKLSIVGLWCIQTRPSERPSMSRVIEMLQAEVGTLQMPPKPFLSAGRVCSMSIRDPSTEASSSTLTANSEQESLTW